MQHDEADFFWSKNWMARIRCAIGFLVESESWFLVLERSFVA